MTMRVSGWTVQIDRALGPAEVTQLERLAAHYGLTVAQTVDGSGEAVGVEIHASETEPLPLLHAATFAVQLTTLLGGGEPGAICEAIADDADIIRARLASEIAVPVA